MEFETFKAMFIIYNLIGFLIAIIATLYIELEHGYSTRMVVFMAILILLAGPLTWLAMFFKLILMVILHITLSIIDKVA